MLFCKLNFTSSLPYNLQFWAINFGSSPEGMHSKASWSFTFLVLGGAITVLGFLYRLYSDSRDRKVVPVPVDENIEADRELLNEMKVEVAKVSQELKSFKESQSDKTIRMDKQFESLSSRVEKLMDLILKLFSNYDVS